ncbi:MAG TPA: hypothetical protein VHJ69_05150 [Gemmatimonadales bacterium]|jgi:hypothetical protein|nr:hypothetical protein [Gemmatimonadales bacterium]
MMMRMRNAGGGWALLLVVACAIEDRTPTGTRRDDEAIQRLLVAYARGIEAGRWEDLRALCWDEATLHLATPTGNLVFPIDSARARLVPQSGPPMEVRILRSDARQEGDLAAAWLVSGRRPAAAAGARETDWTEHLVLRRIGGEWKILVIAPANGVRPRT